MTDARKKERARSAVRRAVASGRLVRPTICQDCQTDPGPAADGRTQIHGHHWKGYDCPLDVEWLCAACHAKKDPRLKGEEHQFAGLTAAQVQAIINAPAPEGLAAQFGILPSSVSAIRAGRAWAHMPGPKQANGHYRDRTHCKRGHEFTPENTYLIGGVGRQCIPCRRERDRIKYYRLKSEATALKGERA